MTIDLSKVKGLCFDVDGTLCDTDDMWVSRISSFLKPLRFLFKGSDPRPFARWLVMATESPMNLFYYWADSLSMDDNFARMFEWLARHRRNHRKSFMLMPGAQNLLGVCSEKYPMTIVSARDARTTIHFLEQFTLQNLFVEVVTSQTCVHTKPYPDPVRFASEAMNLPAENCLMIGDTTVDILAGKRAGAQTIGLLCGFGTEKELRKAGADLIVNDLQELHLLFMKGLTSKSHSDTISNSTMSD